MHANTWPRTFVFWWVSPDHLQTEVIYNKLLSIYFSFKLRLHWFGRKLCVKSDYFICEGSLKIVKRALENTLITSGHGVTWGWKLLLLVVLGCLHVPELRLKVMKGQSDDSAHPAWAVETTTAAHLWSWEGASHFVTKHITEAWVILSPVSQQILLFSVAWPEQNLLY